MGKRADGRCAAGQEWRRRRWGEDEGEGEALGGVVRCKCGGEVGRDHTQHETRTRTHTHSLTHSHNSTGHNGTGQEEARVGGLDGRQGTNCGCCCC